MHVSHRVNLRFIGRLNAPKVPADDELMTMEPRRSPRSHRAVLINQELGPVKKSSAAVRKQHRILISTDGSRTAQAALATVVKFPWPASVQVRAVVARSSWLPAASEHARAAVEESFAAAVAAAGSALARRWPESKVVVVDGSPVDVILAEAQRFEASLIALGWRGHGVFRRLWPAAFHAALPSALSAPSWSCARR